MAEYVDVEHDKFFLKKVLEDGGYPEIAQIIKRAFDTVIAERAVDFKENVGKAITDCLNVNGVPMFRTRYSKVPFPNNSVLMVCYGSRGRMHGVWLKNAPDEDIRDLAAKRDGYRLMLAKYGRIEKSKYLNSHKNYLYV